MTLMRQRLHLTLPLLAVLLLAATQAQGNWWQKGQELLRGPDRRSAPASH
jgi:hypothetical protein